MYDDTQTKQRSKYHVVEILEVYSSCGAVNMEICEQHIHSLWQ